MWNDDCERCERHCEQCDFLQLQRCNYDRRRLFLRSELLRRVDEHRVRRRVRVEFQQFRRQCQFMWNDDCERCECQCEQCAFVQLQRCNDNYRSLVFWSDRLRRVDECRVCRRLRLEFQHRRQQRQHRDRHARGDHNRPYQPHAGDDAVLAISQIDRVEQPEKAQQREGRPDRTQQP